MPPANKPPAHSRWLTLRSAIRLRLAISRASDRLPISQLFTGVAWPITRMNASCTRLCDQVKSTLGPVGISTSDDRSTKVRPEKNFEAARATCRTLPGSRVL